MSRCARSVSRAAPRPATTRSTVTHPVRRPGGRPDHVTPPPTRSSGRSPPRPRWPTRPRRCRRTSRAAALDHVSPAAGRAGRGGRPADHRGERQADHVGAGRGRPGRVDVPLGGRGGPALLRRAAAARHRPGGDRADRAGPPRAARARCWASRPFNFPLNLVAHKVAPAIAVGAPIVVKPAPATPLSALLLGEMLAETDLPAGMFSVLPVPERPRRRRWSPTRGCRWSRSPARARSARRSGRPVPHKHVTLELGGNAAAVVCADWTATADLDWAAQPDRHVRQLPGRAELHRGAAGDRARAALRRLRADGWSRRSRRCAPATRPTSDRRRAADQRGAPPSGSRSGSTRRSRPGATVLAGGRRDGADATRRPCSPTCPADAKVCAEEVFGPVLVLARVDVRRRRRSRRSTTRRTGCRRACSRTTCRPAFRGAPRRWRSAA